MPVTYYEAIKFKYSQSALLCYCVLWLSSAAATAATATVATVAPTIDANESLIKMFKFICCVRIK